MLNRFLNLILWGLRGISMAVCFRRNEVLFINVTFGLNFHESQSVFLK